jgi:DnaJ-class molecular chaperone
MINYYNILELPDYCYDSKEIKRSYRRLVLLNHPDKSDNSDKFILIQTGYEILMNKYKKKEYDLKLKYNFLEKYNLYNLTDDDYNYIEKILESEEFKLIKLLYKTLPNIIKKNMNSYFNNETNNQVKDIVLSNKFIDISKLKENFTLDLIIKLNDVYCNKLKIIIIKTTNYICYLYIRDFKDFYIMNEKFFFNINFRTEYNANIFRKGDNLYYKKDINLFELYYGLSFKIRLLNNEVKLIREENLLNKKSSIIKNNGFNNGDLIIIYNIIHKKLDNKYREIMKDIFDA